MVIKFCHVGVCNSVALWISPAVVVLLVVLGLHVCFSKLDIIYWLLVSFVVMIAQNMMIAQNTVKGNLYWEWNELHINTFLHYLVFSWMFDIETSLETDLYTRGLFWNISSWVCTLDITVYTEPCVYVQFETWGIFWSCLAIYVLLWHHWGSEEFVS